MGEPAARKWSRRQALGLIAAELDGVRVAVAAHEVVYDAQRQRWACDLVLPPGMSYRPFVSLALARYQPNSVAGVELSPLAAVEWAQLTPDRSATVGMDLRDPTRLRVSVAGRAPGGTNAAPGQTNAVSAIVQSATSFTPGELDWQVVGPAEGYPLTPGSQGDGTTVWTASLKLPASRLLKPHRLVITEWERHGGGGRLVYSDVIRL